MKISRLNGGVQYWWEAEDFDARDEAVFVLHNEPASTVKDLPGASGGAYIVHNAPNPPNNSIPGKDEAFVKYLINITAGGAYFIWARSSWDRAPSGRTHNSFWVQVNGAPDTAKFVRHVDSMGDANWLDKWDENNPWTWIGDSAQPVALQGQPGGGLQNGLKRTLNAGENTITIYHREGGLDGKAMCTDVLMISTVDFAPTDADYEKASFAPVEPKDKLTTIWARMKIGG
jgi:hypothetical protein